MSFHQVCLTLSSHTLFSYFSSDMNAQLNGHSLSLIENGMKGSIRRRHSIIVACAAHVASRAMQHMPFNLISYRYLNSAMLSIFYLLIWYKYIYAMVQTH